MNKCIFISDFVDILLIYFQFLYGYLVSSAQGQRVNVSAHSMRVGCQAVRTLYMYILW